MDSCNNKLIPGTSNFWKLDKIDKIVIALWFIGFAIFCIGDCFAVESVTIQPTVVEGLYISNGTVVESSTGYCAYFQLKESYYYNITNNTQGTRTYLYFSDIPVVGSTFNYYLTVQAGQTVTIIAEQGFLVLSDFSSNSSVGYFTDVQEETRESMEKSVDSLVNNVGQEQIWSIFDTGVPIALLVVIVAFGIFIIGFASRKIQKGKMGI